MRSIAAALVAIALVAPSARARAPVEGRPLLGTRAPELRDLRFLEGPPVTLAQLRGKLVIVRFWTDGCELCMKSLPALEAIEKRHGGRVVLLAIHHPKSEASRDPEVVRRAAHALGLSRVITDPAWATVRAYGVGTVFKSYTSTSYLVDGEGVIRWVHDGGVIEPDALAALEAEIEKRLGDQRAHGRGSRAKRRAPVAASKIWR